MNKHIPRNIIQFWEGPASLSITKLMDKWPQLNPGYSYYRFDYSSALEWLYTKYGRDSLVLQSFASARFPAMMSDIFRVAWLFKEGGIYADAATEPLTAIKTWPCNHNSSSILMRKWHGKIWNGLIISKQALPMLEIILNKICNNVSTRLTNDIWQATGPGNYQFLDNYSPNDGSIQIIPQETLAKSLKLVNTLPHKGGNIHWSSQQRSQSIYCDISAAHPSIIVHLGPHKTASTSLQVQLEANESHFLANGIGIITVRSTLKNLYKPFRDMYTKVIQGVTHGSISDSATCLAVIKLAELLTDLVRYSPVSVGTLILSDENLLGPQTGHYFAGKKLNTGIYPASMLVFCALKLAYKENLKSVLLVRRDYSDWLSSVYKDYVSKGVDQVYPLAWRKRLHPNLREQYMSFFNIAQCVLDDRLSILEFDEFVNALSSTPMPAFFDLNISKAAQADRRDTARPIVLNRSMPYQQIYSQLSLEDSELASSSTTDAIASRKNSFDDFLEEASLAFSD